MTIALSLFAGVGVGIALDHLGISELGVDNDPSVNATRAMHGMINAFDDAWQGAWERSLAPEHDLLMASPPCQAWSMSGGKAGHAVMDDILAMIEDGTYAKPNRLAEAVKDLDPRIGLVLLPLLYAMRDRPAYIVLEQVPSVAPIWRAYAEELRWAGYSVWTGVLDAEQFGIPQTRRRAILLASRVRTVTAPVPTHSKYHTRRPDHIDPGMPRWVSMADALGGEGGVIGFPRLADSMGESIELDGVLYRERDLRSTDRPSFVVTSKVRSWRRWGFTKRPAITVVNAVGRGLQGGSGGRLAVTNALADGSFIPSQGDGSVYAEATRITVDEAATLQSYPEGFTFAGSKTSQFLQVANSFPPLWAERLIAHTLGISLT